MPVISDSALAALVRRHFGDLPLGTQRFAFAIALAESGGHIEAWNRSGEDSRGLWQINVGPGANTDMAAWDLFDPDVNARAARVIHDRNSGWCPWSVYEEWCSRGHTGSYRTYLPRARAALPEPGPAPGPPPGPPPGPRPIPNRTLVTHAGSGGRVWVISGGRRREIVMLRTPGDVFAACGYDLGLVQTLPRERVLAMPTGPNVTGPPDCPFGGRVPPTRLADVAAPALLAVLLGAGLIAYARRR